MILNMPDSIETRMKLAINAYKSQKDAKIKQLASDFGLKYTALYHRIHGRKSRQERVSTNTRLDSNQEQALVAWIRNLYGFGMPPTKERALD
jgi:hypothetical protein